MKNTWLKYILIFLVVLIWGLVFYRIFNYNSDENVIIYNPKELINKQNEEIVKDTFKLFLNYPDPFLKRNKNIKTELSASNFNNQKITQIKKDYKKQKNNSFSKRKFKPTKVEYGGKITNVFSKNKTAVIRIENKNKLLSDGDIIGDIEILKIYNDSIIIKDKGFKRTILKK